MNCGSDQRDNGEAHRIFEIYHSAPHKLRKRRLQNKHPFTKGTSNWQLFSRAQPLPLSDKIKQAEEGESQSRWWYVSAVLSNVFLLKQDNLVIIRTCDDKEKYDPIYLCSVKSKPIKRKIGSISASNPSDSDSDGLFTAYRALIRSIALFRVLKGAGNHLGTFKSINFSTVWPWEWWLLRRCCRERSTVGNKGSMARTFAWSKATTH